jgi:hypothetical protein
MTWLDLLGELARPPMIRLLIPEIESPVFNQIFAPKEVADFQILYQAVQERASQFGRDFEVRTTGFPTSAFIVADREVSLSIIPRPKSRMAEVVIVGETNGSFGIHYLELFETLWKAGKKFAPPLESRDVS